MDGLGHPVTVYAATNPGRDMGREPKALHNKMPGYAIVRVNKADRTYTVECWPRYAVPGKDPQYEGWPHTVTQADNYGREAAAWLPQIKVEGLDDPVVKVINEETGETLYTLRVKGTSFRPKVFKEGVYTVVVGEQEPERLQRLTGLKTGPEDEVSERVVRF
jgi:hypothetical protein